MRENEITYTVPAKVGKSYRHMRDTFTYAYSFDSDGRTVHIWKGASTIRQTYS